MSDNVRKRFLDKEWAGNKPCVECPDGHPTCLWCGGTKPGLVCTGLPTIHFGHQMIDQGDYKDDCIYVMIEEEMQEFLNREEAKAEAQRRKALCAKEGHEPGEERVGTMHTVTVAITPELTCQKCGVTYRGKKRKVTEGD